MTDAREIIALHAWGTLDDCHVAADPMITDLTTAIALLIATLKALNVED